MSFSPLVCDKTIALHYLEGKKMEESVIGYCLEL